MVDLILLTFVGTVFAGGFWCGKTFKTTAAMLERIKQAIK